jgi:hypothetical protein
MALLFGCGCFGYSACGSSKPVTGSCPVEDFNGECCIRQSDCNENDANNAQTDADAVNGCHAIDPEMAPLLCLSSFNAAALPSNCKQLTIVEGCMGTDDPWGDGKQEFFYNVWCCK